MNGPWGSCLGLTQFLEDGKNLSDLTRRATSFDPMRTSILRSTAKAVSLGILPMVGLTVCREATTKVGPDNFGVLGFKLLQGPVSKLRANCCKILKLMPFMEFCLHLSGPCREQDLVNQGKGTIDKVNRGNSL